MKLKNSPHTKNNRRKTALKQLLKTFTSNTIPKDKRKIPKNKEEEKKYKERLKKNIEVLKTKIIDDDYAKMIRTKKDRSNRIKV